MNSSFPPVSLAVLATLLAGCGGVGWPVEPGGPSRPGVLLVQVTATPGSPEVEEVAVQDGDGRWQLLALGGGPVEVEVRDPLGRYGVALTTSQASPGGSRQRFTSVERWTLAERATFAWGSPGPAQGPGIVLPNVRLTGLAAGSAATVTFGREQRWLQATGAGAFVHLTPGRADLVVGLPSFSERPNRVLVRRGQVLGSRGGPLELNVREAQEVALRPLPLSGWTGDDWVATQSWLVPSNAATPGAGAIWADLGQWYTRGAGAEVQVLPEALADPGDRYMVEAWARSEGQVSEGRYVAGPLEALEGGAELPPPAGGTFATDLEGHPAWSWSLRSPGASLLLTVSRSEPAGYRSLWVSISPGSRGGASGFALANTGACPALHAATGAWATASAWAVTLNQVAEGASCSRSGALCWSWTAGMQ